LFAPLAAEIARPRGSRGEGENKNAPPNPPAGERRNEERGNDERPSDEHEKRRRKKRKQQKNNTFSFHFPFSTTAAPHVDNPRTAVNTNEPVLLLLPAGRMKGGNRGATAASSPPPLAQALARKKKCVRSSRTPACTHRGVGTSDRLPGPAWWYAARVPMRVFPADPCRPKPQRPKPPRANTQHNCRAENDMAEVERRIYDLETSYLEETAGFNIAKGWNGFGR
jgi:hypothetical protein